MNSDVENSPALRRNEVHVFRMPTQLVRKKTAHGNNRFVSRSKIIERLPYQRRAKSTAFPTRFDFRVDHDHDMIERVIFNEARFVPFDQRFETSR